MTVPAIPSKWIPIALCVAALSCGPDSMDPGQTGGELLPGTEEYDYLGGSPFSLSPDGRWLLFSSGFEAEPPDPSLDLEEIMLQHLSAYVLYDLERRVGTPIGLGSNVPDVAERAGGSFIPNGGCWIPREGGWWAAVVSAFGGYLAVDPSSADPEWVGLETEAFAYREYCPVGSDDWTVPPSIGPFRITEARGRRVRIVDGASPDNVLATHRAPRFPGTEASLNRLRLSPGESRLAYVVSLGFGSFSGASSAFVLTYDAAGAEPTPLATSVDALRWGEDDSTLFAGVRGPEARGIYRWSLTALGG